MTPSPKGRKKPNVVDAYECYRCKTRHTTENMVAYCASCFAALRARLQAAESECQEQARLNGMGAEREAKLMAENERLREKARKIVSEGGRCLTCANEQQYNDAKVRAAEFVLFLARELLAPAQPADEKHGCSEVDSDGTCCHTPQCAEGRRPKEDRP